MTLRPSRVDWTSCAKTQIKQGIIYTSWWSRGLRNMGACNMYTGFPGFTINLYSDSPDDDPPTHAFLFGSTQFYFAITNSYKVALTHYVSQEQLIEVESILIHLFDRINSWLIIYIYHSDSMCWCPRCSTSTCTIARSGRFSISPFNWFQWTSFSSAAGSSLVIMKMSSNYPSS